MVQTSGMWPHHDQKAERVRTASQEKLIMKTLKRIRAGEPFFIGEHLLVANVEACGETSFVELYRAGDEWSAKPRQLSVALLKACMLENVLHFPFEADPDDARCSAVRDAKDPVVGFERQWAGTQSNAAPKDGSARRVPGTVRRARARRPDTLAFVSSS